MLIIALYSTHRSGQGIGKHRIIRCCRFRIKVNQWFRTPWGAFSAFFSVSLVSEPPFVLPPLLPTPPLGLPSVPVDVETSLLHGSGGWRAGMVGVGGRPLL